MKEDKIIKRVALILILILILSAIILVYFGKKRHGDAFFDYNGFEVRKTNTGYRIKIFINENQQENYINIRHDPRDLESIYVEDKIKEGIVNKDQIYVAVDPYENLTSTATIAALEIDSKLDNPFLFNIPVNSAFVKKYGESVVKTCNDVNETVGVIWLRLGNETKVYSENKCIILEGPTELDLVMAADKLILVLLEIIE